MVKNKMEKEDKGKKEEGRRGMDGMKAESADLKLLRQDPLRSR